MSAGKLQMMYQIVILSELTLIVGEVILRRVGILKCLFWHESRQHLKQLQPDTSIVSLPADKGKSTVVLNRVDYFEKCMDHINNDIIKASRGERVN